MTIFWQNIKLIYFCPSETLTFYRTVIVPTHVINRPDKKKLKANFYIRRKKKKKKKSFTKSVGAIKLGGWIIEIIISLMHQSKK